MVAATICRMHVEAGVSILDCSRPWSIWEPIGKSTLLKFHKGDASDLVLAATLLLLVAWIKVRRRYREYLSVEYARPE